MIGVVKIKTVFIDRDGTINEDKDGYIDHPDRFQLFQGAADSIKKLNIAGYKVFVITNQSGIARGYYSFEDLERVHKKMIQLLDEKKAIIDEILISPYHKEGIIEPYNCEHDDRKPGLGLFNRVKSQYDIDLKSSFMIGDKYSDIEFGKKAGLKTILVLSGHGKREFRENRNDWKFLPDLIVKNISIAVNVILKIGDKI